MPFSKPDDLLLLEKGFWKSFLYNSCCYLTSLFNDCSQVSLHFHWVGWTCRTMQHLQLAWIMCSFFCVSCCFITISSYVYLKCALPRHNSSLQFKNISPNDVRSTDSCGFSIHAFMTDALIWGTQRKPLKKFVKIFLKARDKKSEEINEVNELLDTDIRWWCKWDPRGNTDVSRVVSYQRFITIVEF